MKILFLNTWGGKLAEPLKAFIVEHVRDTDVFCFQEAYDEVVEICTSLLPNFTLIQGHKYITDRDNFPQATYVRGSYKILGLGTVLDEVPGTGLGLWTHLSTENGELYISNFHGMSRPGDKQDTPERLNASRALIEHARGYQCRHIIGGDFNLMPDIESVRMFETAGYCNLIKDYKIPTTRNRCAWENYSVEKQQLFSDYVFITPDAEILEFEVPQNEISDHLPMILTIQ